MESPLPQPSYKYNLQNLVKRDDNNILSNVFYTYVSDFLQELIDERKDQTAEEVDSRMIEIELTIDGHKCDPEKFFNKLYEQYSGHIEHEANRIIRERVSDRFWELSDKLDDYKNILVDMIEEADLTVDKRYSSKKDSSDE